MKKLFLILTVLFAMTAVLFASGQGSAGPAASGQGGIPGYINLDGYHPVVKQCTNVSMTVSWEPDTTFAKHSDPSQIWWFKYVKERMNIDLRVIPRAPGPEAKNLMFASGDLQDIWMSGLNNNDIVLYGVGEKMLLPLTSYINPTLMPILSKLYQDQPDLKTPSIAPDGNIYGFSNFRAKDWLHGPITGGFARPFYNKKWLDQLGAQVPTTLDQYLALLRRFKTIGSDVLPDSGVFKAANNYCMVFSALGFYWTNSNSITGPGTRNDKVTFMYGDREIYRKFLETYKIMYDEGLITKDFFTMENNTRTALTMAGKGGVIPSAPVTFVGPQFQFDYVSVKPLTSELNNKIFWIGPSNYVGANVIALTKSCKYPEAVARMFDFHFDPANCLLITFGYPDTMQEYLYGMIPGWSIGINDNFVDMHFNTSQYESENFFAMSRIRPFNNMVGMVGNNAAIAKKIYGLNPPAEKFDPTNADSFGRGSTYDNLSQHTTFGFPFTVYWDQQTSRRLTDLGSVINDYAEVQFAQFVSGARPISDLNNYFAELDRLNYQEYLKYYSDYYAKLK